jgi:hypothetical protein
MLNRLRTMVLLLGMTLTAACSGLNPLSLLTGGGPNVAANTQLGKTNSQTIGTTNTVEQVLVRPQANTIRQSNDTSTIQADKVDHVTINETPLWIIILLVLGWLLPSPNEISRVVRQWFTRSK